MAKDLPYLASYKNVASLFEKISSAKVPDSFTVRYLADTLGLKSTGDRQLISLLKKLGFLDNAGKPTTTYSLLKNQATAKLAIATGMKAAYAPLFEANEAAYALSGDSLKGLIAQVSGAEENMVRAITGTFNALLKAADFTQVKLPPTPAEEEEEDEESEEVDSSDTRQTRRIQKRQFNPDFRFNIEIHLPSNGTEETYLAIFNALRKSLG